mmetsp:Transcript_6730/g.10794  ORF Transcript_6730/g.10794 Transcript_6730/m.10794 type:complete len:91 (-) Transcript_6730:128-400(-)
MNRFCLPKWVGSSLARIGSHTILSKAEHRHTIESTSRSNDAPTYHQVYALANPHSRLMVAKDFAKSSAGWFHHGNSESTNQPNADRRRSN